VKLGYNSRFVNCEGWEAVYEYYKSK